MLQFQWQQQKKSVLQKEYIITQLQIIYHRCSENFHLDYHYTLVWQFYQIKYDSFFAIFWGKGLNICDRLWQKGAFHANQKNWVFYANTVYLNLMLKYWRVKPSTCKETGSWTGLYSAKAIELEVVKT